ncbi:MAG: alanine--tRNA ligase [Euryarchaeota archaeon]|nr:alanine--tRNA ligase [Euryarchaeota archaeon]
MLEKELNLDYFHREGFKRYRCKKCGAYFWSTVPRDNCTEAPCGTYKFLDVPLFKREFEIEDMRKYFIDFFKNRGHTPVRRYPVVARWRDDVFLVNASIYDFQPHVTSGLVEPPANPLVISQPCIRMVDVDSVGKTGRHLTGFEMMAHHAFNYPDNHIYWKDETVAYAIELLESLGVSREDIVLKEHPWFGGGNAGASFEVIVGGLELATLVFMNLRESESGPIEIDGVRYEEMPIKIVDTGYGLERFVWVSKRTPTIYEAIYPDMVNKMLSLTGIEMGEKEEQVLRLLARSSSLIESMGERRFMEYFIEQAGITREYYEKKIVPIQKLYAVVDYSRSLSFMLTDGIIPSNIKAGYLARLLIRRALKILDDFGNPISLYELVELHARRFADIMDTSMLPIIKEELELEEERYRATMKRGREIVKKMLKKGALTVDDLILLYDSHGLLPDVVQRIAAENGVTLEIPENFHALVAKRHEGGARKKKKETREYALPPTIKLYYRDPYMRSFEAKVIYSEGTEIVLDRTAFYPEGGGQPCDLGKIIYNGREIAVQNVQKYGDVVVHTLSEPVPEGAKIRGEIDWERRERLMRMHTAEHVLLAACRRVLGKHVWQHGTQKDVYESRFDIGHFRPISREEIKEIEKEAMRIITSNVPVEAKFMNRREAEDRYGFVLYEGGVPPGKEIRVVRIDDYDVEACGGTHVRSTGEIGFLKILRTERIQDGVSRIIYSAGLSALEKVQEMEDTLQSTATLLNAPVDAVSDKVQSLMEMWKAERREKENALKYKIGYVKQSVVSQAVDGRVAAVVDLDHKEMQKLMRELSQELSEVVLISKDGHIMVWSSEGNARELARRVAEAMHGKAGGRPEFAQGKGAQDRVNDGFNIAKQVMGL